MDIKAFYDSISLSTKIALLSRGVQYKESYYPKISSYKTSLNVHLIVLHQKHVYQ